MAENSVRVRVSLLCAKDYRWERCFSAELSSNDKELILEVKTIFWERLLQSVIDLLQSATALFITKCDGGVLQSATGITKCDWGYYKVRQVLQSATIITKCDSTGSNCLALHCKFCFERTLGNTESLKKLRETINLPLVLMTVKTLGRNNGGLAQITGSVLIARVTQTCHVSLRMCDTCVTADYLPTPVTSTAHKRSTCLASGKR